MHSSGAARAWRRRRAPFVELVVLVVLFVGYNLVRAYATASTGIAVQHGQWLRDLEGPLFTHLEVPLNAWLNATPVLAVPACYYYAALHYLATPTVLLLSWRRGGWPYWRGYWTLVLASAIALVGYALFPAAPPRLVPGLGIHDVLLTYSHAGWWGGAASAPRGIGEATNQFAAMPSMHVGWALWCGIVMWGFGGRVWRTLAVLYPGLLVVVVLATGNHFLIDAVAGVACVLVAFAVVTVTHRMVVGRALVGAGHRVHAARGMAHAEPAPVVVRDQEHPR